MVREAAGTSEYGLARRLREGSTELFLMQTLRLHSDVSRSKRTSDALGRDAALLGRRVLAAAQAATAMHLATTTANQLRPESRVSATRAEDPR